MSLKQKQTKITRIKDSIKDIKGEISVLNKQLTVYEKELEAAERDLEQFQSKELTVSEHAMLRYLERVGNFDINAIESAILQRIKPLYETLGDGKYPINEVLKAVVKNKVIVTVIEN